MHKNGQKYSVELQRNGFFTLPFEVSWFNTEQYIRFCNPEAWYGFGLKDESGQYCAVFYLFTAGDQGFNPIKAPYGSVEFSAEANKEGLRLLIESIQNKMVELGLKNLRIRSYPQSYAFNANILHEVLVSTDFKVLIRDLSYYLPVDMNDFRNKIHLSEKRRLDKSGENGFAPRILDPSFLPACFALLQSARMRKGFALTISEALLSQLLAQFPHKYVLFGCLKDGHLAAFAVGVKVSEAVLYYFIPADDGAYLPYSPGLAVLEVMYGFALINGYRLLDLGTATDKGLRNEGLINFKKKLGGVEESVLTYVWERGF